MEYMILCYESRLYSEAQMMLEQNVREYIKEGWKPQGGVSITSNQIGSTFYYAFAQAMIKGNY